MDPTLSPEESMLVGSARGMLTGRTSLAATRAHEAGGPRFDPLVWAEMARLGWLGLAGAERFVEVALVCEEMGRAMLVSPFIPAIAMAAPLLARDERARRLAAGDLVATVAVAEPGARSVFDPPALPSTSGRVTGRKSFVPFAADADVVLVGLAGAKVAIVERRDFTCTRSAALGGDPLYEVAFEDAPADQVDSAASLAEILDRGAVASLAYLAGAAERALAMTLEHAKTREQFGRPIGSFQAVAHRCVDMRSDVDALRVLVHQAAWTIATRRPDDVAIGSALAYGLAALRRVARHAHQVHGAIGFSMEHDLQLFTRRAKAAELQWGPPARHHERVARGMGL
jgi:alkylation response protein AidB-like acyl-CoA dehydrogenase